MGSLSAHCGQGVFGSPRGAIRVDTRKCPARVIAPALHRPCATLVQHHGIMRRQAALPARGGAVGHTEMPGESHSPCSPSAMRYASATALHHAPTGGALRAGRRLDTAFSMLRTSPRRALWVLRCVLFLHQPFITSHKQPLYASSLFQTDVNTFFCKVLNLCTLRVEGGAPSAPFFFSHSS